MGEKLDEGIIPPAYPGARRKFTEAYKARAVARALEPGATITQVAEEFDIVTSVLGRWITLHQHPEVRRKRGTYQTTREKREAAKGEAKTVAVPAVSTANPALVAEIKSLREQLARVTKERDLLKKTLGHYIEEP